MADAYALDLAECQSLGCPIIPGTFRVCALLCVCLESIIHIDWICDLYCAQVRLPVDFTAGQRMKVNIPHGFPQAHPPFKSNLADACICIEKDVYE